MLSGTTAMTVTSDGEEYDVDLEFPKGTYDNASQLMDADIGGIPLSELATVEYTNAAQTIMKMDGKYTVTVTASCLSDDKSDIQDAMDQLLTTLDLPDSVSGAKTLMDTMQDDMFGDMGKALATAVFLVFLVMAMQFESPKYSLMVMLSIPFSLIGAFGLVFISGIDFSMVGLMGVLTLVGTVVNNGILYVDGVNMMPPDGCGGCPDRSRQDQTSSDPDHYTDNRHLHDTKCPWIWRKKFCYDAGYGTGHHRRSGSVYDPDSGIDAGILSDRIWNQQEEQTGKETEILFLEEKNKYRKAFGRSIKALKREGITENRNPLFGLPQA